MNDEYMVVLINNEFAFRRVASQQVRVIRNGIAEFKKQPELFEGEILAITYPPDGIYRIIKHDD